MVTEGHVRQKAACSIYTLRTVFDYLVLTYLSYLLTESQTKQIAT